MTGHSRQSLPAHNGGLQTLCDEGSVDAAGALHMDALQALVDVCQHLCTESPVAGLCLQGVQLAEGQGVQ